MQCTHLLMMTQAIIKITYKHEQVDKAGGDG